MFFATRTGLLLCALINSHIQSALKHIALCHGTNKKPPWENGFVAEDAQCDSKITLQLKHRQYAV